MLVDKTHSKKDIVNLFRKLGVIINDDLTKGKIVSNIENYIEFWFCDTNSSKQGEELYLSMNSRGESMQSNENLKALLLKDSPNKNDYGKKWEDWQHFFWINKGSSINADKGFNLFKNFRIKKLYSIY